MTRAEYAEKAAAYKNNGFNCCQAVVKALAEFTGAEEELLTRLGAGFGGGMGCMEATCGALVGAGMIAGLAAGPKRERAAAREIVRRFEDAAGAVTCRDIKGRDTGRVLCACDDCVRRAVEITMEVCGL